MQFRLRTLMILLGVAPPALAWLYFGRAWLGLIIAWVLVSSFFALWYWMLLKSQAMDPRTRGSGESWIPPGSGSAS